MQRIIVFFVFAVCYVAAEPNHCCYNNATLIGTQCSNNVDSWMENVCLFGFENVTEFTILENDTMLLPNDNSVPKYWFCLANLPYDNETNAFICTRPDLSFLMYAYFFRIACTLISPICIISTLIVYSRLPYLRDIMGLSLTSFIVTLTVYDLTMILEIGAFSECFLVTITQFTRMSMFFWMTVIAFEVWRLVKHIAIFSHKRHMMFLYSAFGWGMPLIALAMTHVIHRIPGNHIKPFYLSTCWYEDIPNWTIYFFVPVMATNLVTLILFCISAWEIWEKRKEYADKKWKSYKLRLTLSVLLFTVTTLSWCIPIIVGISVYPVIFMDPNGASLSLESILVFFILIVYRKRVRRDLARNRICCVCLPSNYAKLSDVECIDLDEDEQNLLQRNSLNAEDPSPEQENE